MDLAAPSIDAESLASVLSEIAEAASETFELQEVFDRVATSVRRVIPFDHMGVVRILDGEWAVKHATTLGAACGAGSEAGAAERRSGPPSEEPSCTEPRPLTSWSPRLRPRPGSIARIDDAKTQLDPAFPGDAEILKAGVRSTLWEPFRTGGAFSGGVWLSSYRSHAFADEHQEMLRPIAALLGSAVEHWRIWDVERRRRHGAASSHHLFGHAILASGPGLAVGRSQGRPQLLSPGALTLRLGGYGSRDPTRRPRRSDALARAACRGGSDCRGVPGACR